MKLKVLSSVLAVFLCILSVRSAVASDVDESTLERKQALERQLQQHLAENLKKFLPPESYSVEASVKFSITKKEQPAQKVSRKVLDLGKLGKVTTLVRRRPKVEVHTVKTESIESVSLHYFVDSSVTEKTKKAMTEMAYLAADFVPEDKIDIQFHPLDRPAPPLSETLYKHRVEAFIAAALFLLFLALVVALRSLTHFSKSLKVLKEQNTLLTETRFLAPPQQDMEYHQPQLTSSNPEDLNLQELVNFEGQVIAAGPDKEMNVYRRLVEEGRTDLAVEVAQRQIPAVLIFNLPAELLLKALSKVSFKKRVGMLAHLDDDLLSYVLKNLEAIDSSIRSLYEEEVLRIKELHPRNRTSIWKNKEWQKTLDFIRSEVASNPAIQNMLKETIETWVGNLSTSGSLKGEQDDHVA